MRTITSIGRSVRRATTRRTSDRALLDLHPAVRDEVLTCWEADNR